ncbi:Mitochondrial import inner membrane translocase subunit tim23 [Kappamyces sp. JEL0680]|nr:Mitochondrial import inner membrane translocase subunit tim23 [Kappamyces sp. JEL0680]
MATSEFVSDHQAANFAFGADNSKAAPEDEEIEMVFIQDNPMQRVRDQDRPRGSFLFLPMRTTADKIWYGTGIAYFAGLGYGGIYGTYRGLATAPNSMFKVRLNSVINQTTRYGPWAANSLGVLALSWSLIDR